MWGFVAITDRTSYLERSEGNDTLSRSFRFSTPLHQPGYQSTPPPVHQSTARSSAFSVQGGAVQPLLGHRVRRRPWSTQYPFGCKRCTRHLHESTLHATRHTGHARPHASPPSPLVAPTIQSRQRNRNPSQSSICRRLLEIVRQQQPRGRRNMHPPGWLSSPVPPSTNASGKPLLTPAPLSCASFLAPPRTPAPREPRSHRSHAWPALPCCPQHRSHAAALAEPSQKNYLHLRASEDTGGDQDETTSCSPSSYRQETCPLHSPPNGMPHDPSPPQKAARSSKSNHKRGGGGRQLERAGGSNTGPSNDDHAKML